MRGFLHTSPVHVSTFEDLVHDAAPDIPTMSLVDVSLLDRARSAGLGDPSLRLALRRRLREFLGADCSHVVCTCSTIGGLAEAVGRDLGLTVTRVDRPMIEAAVARGGRLVVLTALESTIAPTLALVDEVAASEGADPDVRVESVDGAWERFEDGDLDAYHRSIAASIERVAGSADVIVLAQASMAPASALARTGVLVLSSPELAVERLLG